MTLPFVLGAKNRSQCEARSKDCIVKMTLKLLLQECHLLVIQDTVMTGEGYSRWMQKIKQYAEEMREINVCLGEKQQGKNEYLKRMREKSTGSSVLRPSWHALDSLNCSFESRNWLYELSPHQIAEGP